MKRSFVDDTLRIRGGALIASIAFHVGIFYAFSKMDVPSPRSIVDGSVEPPLRIQVQLIATRTINDIPSLSVAASTPAMESSEIPVGIIDVSSEADTLAVPNITETSDHSLLSNEVHAIEAAPAIAETIDSLVLSDETQSFEAKADS